MLGISGLKRCLLVTAVLGLSVCLISNSAFAHQNNIQLKFKKDKTFKIVQFTDTQDTNSIDPRTITLMSKVMDNEKPDLVVFTGDNIRGCNTADEVKKAINNIASPVEKRKIPWLITFGNHDDESRNITGVGKDEMLKMYMSYSYNINEPNIKGVDGTGNMNALVYGSKSGKPEFNVWGLDSGTYAPKDIAGQPTNVLSGYSWIKFSQIQWYYNTSQELEKKYGKKIPSLMFFHIPLQEFGQMWATKDIHNVVGERNETECPGAFNSGLFAALLERGDVKGIFTGHDHINDYVGNYYGVMLGYSANTGFGTYGLDGSDKNRLRGARVFNINEGNTGTFETHMIFAKDLGIQ